MQIYYQCPLSIYYWHTITESFCSYKITVHQEKIGRAFLLLRINICPETYINSNRHNINDISICSARFYCGSNEVGKHKEKEKELIFDRTPLEPDWMNVMSWHFKYLQGLSPTASGARCLHSWRSFYPEHPVSQETFLCTIAHVLLHPQLHYW